MAQIDIISIVESSMHPNFSEEFRQKGLTEEKVNSVRKAINLLKKQPVRYIVAEFFYAYSTNYSGIHKSNLDVLLVSLRKYSPNTHVIVLVSKEERQYLNVLDALDFPLHAVLQHPVTRSQISEVL
jgi:hypothetical protein